MVTGPCCDIGWYLHLDEGSLPDLTIYLDQMVPTGGLIFSTSYPQGARISVQRCVPDCEAVSIGSSLREVLDAPGNVAFIDSKGRLFMKLLHEGSTYFEVAGITQLMNGQRWYGGKGIRYLVQSSSSGAVEMDLPSALPSTASTAIPTTSTTTRAITSTTVSISSTQVSSTSGNTIDLFLPVDGGANRVCRGDGPRDNNVEYYKVLTGMPDLNACMVECLNEPECKGIEFKESIGRCEIWTRSGGVQASAGLDGYECWSLNSLVPTTITTTTTSTTTRTTTRMSSCVAKWEDCRSSRCCLDEGFQCFKEHTWYSQCRHACPSDWDCEVLVP